MTAQDGSAPRPDVELLADLDAGLLDEARAERVRAAADADPAATTVLAALAATRAELAALRVPAPPAGAVERWGAALAAEAARPGRSGPSTGQSAGGPPTERSTGTRPPSRPDRAPSTAGRGRSIGSGSRSPRAQRSRSRVPLAAAALLVVLAAGLLWPRPDPGRIDLAAAGRSAIGSSDLGALADPIRRAGCLRAAGVLGLAPDAPPLGGRRVELARGPGVLLVFGTGELGVFDVVIVDPDCGPAGGTLLGTARIGR